MNIILRELHLDIRITGATSLGIEVAHEEKMNVRDVNKNIHCLREICRLSSVVEFICITPIP